MNSSNTGLITRRGFLGGLAAGAALAGLRSMGLQEAWAAGKPNFVVIFCDDLGYSDVGCFGSKLISTSRVDRMAAEGVRFTDFYAAAPVCTPSRAALMTGCYPARVSLPQVLGPQAKVGVSADEVTMAELLKAQGYATACIGKWHLGHHPQFLPTRHGFDYYYGIPYSNDMSKNGNQIPLFRNEKIIERPVKQETLTERYTQEAIRFIKDNRDKPFLLYLPHTFPHIPLHVSERFSGRSKRGLYGDVVETIDWSTGEILDTLAKLGLDRNTLVIFTSDNGPWLSKKDNGGSALPLRSGKGTTWEGGMREPCVMRWPGRIPAGTVCSEVATTMDMLPTFARLAGAKLPSDRIIDGKDIWPLMSGKPGAVSPYEAFFYYRVYELQAVRSGRWKLVLPHKEKTSPVPLALYDLKNDIGEEHDVSGSYPTIVKRLQELAAECRTDLGDAITHEPGKNRRPCGRVM